MIAEADLDGDGGIDLDEFGKMLEQYFANPPKLKGKWPKPKSSKNDLTLKAKVRALEPRSFRTVEDDSDSRSSCAMSSFSQTSQLRSKGPDSDTGSEDSEEEVQELNSLKTNRLPGAPSITKRAPSHFKAAGEVAQERKPSLQIAKTPMKLGLPANVAQIISL